MKKEKEEAVTSFLTVGTQFVGDIEAKDDLCIHGVFTGTISTCKKLIIGLTGQVEGDIRSSWITVFGSVTGNILSSGVVCLKNTSRVTGTIKSAQIEIESGAEFNGDCCIEQLSSCGK